jgi:hypothetical protein
LRAKEKVFPNNWGFIKRFFLKNFQKKLIHGYQMVKEGILPRKLEIFGSFMNERIKAYYST